MQSYVGVEGVEGAISWSVSISNLFPSSLTLSLTHTLSHSLNLTLTKSHTHTHSHSRSHSQSHSIKPFSCPNCASWCKVAISQDSISSAFFLGIAPGFPPCRRLWKQAGSIFFMFWKQKVRCGFVFLSSGFDRGRSLVEWEYFLFICPTV